MISGESHRNIGINYTRLPNAIHNSSSKAAQKSKADAVELPPQLASPSALAPTQRTITGCKPFPRYHQGHRIRGPIAAIVIAFNLTPAMVNAV